MDPDLVDELLVAELEVALTPATNSLILREGETVAGAGYVVEGHRYKPWFWDAGVAARGAGLRVVRVAGTGFTGEAIERDEFAPLKPVRLVAEPENEHDGDAVAIYDESGSVRGGYVPRGIASDVKRDLESGRLGRARVVWHCAISRVAAHRPLRDDPAATAAGPGGRCTRGRCARRPPGVGDRRTQMTGPPLAAPRSEPIAALDHIQPFFSSYYIGEPSCKLRRLI